MKFALRSSILIPIVVALPLFLLGCKSTARTARIQEKSTVFSTLSPIQQHQIKNGGIDLGFSTDMVYMALGQPTKITGTGDPKDTIWIFTNYYPADFVHRTGGSIRRNGAPKTAKVANQTGTNGGFGTAGSENSIELPDMASYTFHVLFRDDKVVDLWLNDEQ